MWNRKFVNVNKKIENMVLVESLILFVYDPPGFANKPPWIQDEEDPEDAEFRRIMGENRIGPVVPNGLDLDPNDFERIRILNDFETAYAIWSEEQIRRRRGENIMISFVICFGVLFAIAVMGHFFQQMTMGNK